MKSELVSDIDLLLDSQISEWPLLARGVEGLRASLTRKERVAGRDVHVRHIPHRIGSTTAAVDAASIARRPCFLCSANLPREEHGIPFDAEFAIFCNPFPILERHLTMVRTEHLPQRIAGSFPAMLRFAERLPDSFVIYNGARCGASAPDHMHFQASSRALFPIAEDARGSGSFIRDYARQVFVIRDDDASRLTRRFATLMQILSEITGDSDEPMVNIAAYFETGAWTVFVFPRGKHRPSVFETGELTVSPATIDLCGVLVVPVRDDFVKIRGADIERIFAEVSLPADRFIRAVERFEKEGRA